MKKLVLILIALSTFSCNVMQFSEPKFTIGMAEQDFKQANRYAMQVYGDEKGIVIYRTYNQVSKSFKFFRFSREKLVQFEEGIYPDDYKFMRI